nr:hypothetical protein [Tanacetum cinerariifolium]
MVGPVQGNEIARRVVDDLIEFNGQTSLNALIAEMEAFDDPGEAFDTLMGLRDDVRVEDAKLMGLNDLIAQAEEEIEMKEAQLKVYIFTLSLKLLIMAALYILDKLAEVVGSSCLQDKMKIVFMQARGSDDSFIALMRDHCFALREIVGRDAATLGVLEQLLAASYAEMRLKASFVAEMEETD